MSVPDLPAELIVNTKQEALNSHQCERDFRPSGESERARVENIKLGG